MSEISELESRISAAMDRIARGVEGLSTAAAAGEAGDAAALKQALEDERLVTAQLEERLRAIRGKQDKQTAAMEQELADLRQTMGKLDTDLQRLRKANAQLSESNQALREANEAGVAEPHLINKAMLAELEALRAARAADVAEADAIKGAIAPLLRVVEEGSDA